MNLLAVHLMRKVENMHEIIAITFRSVIFLHVRPT